MKVTLMNGEQVEGRFISLLKIEPVGYGYRVVCNHGVINYFPSKESAQKCFDGLLGVFKSRRVER